MLARSLSFCSCKGSLYMAFPIHVGTRSRSKNTSEQPRPLHNLFSIQPGSAHACPFQEWQGWHQFCIHTCSARPVLWESLCGFHKVLVVCRGLTLPSWCGELPLGPGVSLPLASQAQPTPSFCALAAGSHCHHLLLRCAAILATM